MALEVRLESDWDIPLQPPKGQQSPVGQFVGRQRERELLANELARSRERSIFVSGYRGVGKTSLVYRALYDVLDSKSEGKSFFLVLLNAAQLEAEVDESDRIAPKHVLVNLIRRLYTASADVDLDATVQPKIESLYWKAVASTYAEEHESARSRTRLRSKTRRTDMTVRLREARHLIWAASFSCAVVLESLPFVAHNAFLRVPVLLLAAPLPFAIQASIQWKRDQTNTHTEALDARQLYSYDNALGNLEYDLETIHRDLAKLNTTTIYVVDELDKLDTAQVVAVLKYFKNLFTLASAIFVFVGGEELSKSFGSNEEVEGIYRSKEYTFFTSRYFLARPESADVRAYLDRIFDVAVESDDHAVLLEKLTDLLIFDAAGDFFDLRQAIRDRITSFEDGVPLLNVASLSPDEEVRVRLQRVIDVVFNEKYRAYRPSRWTENEMIRRALYVMAQRIATGYAGMSVEEPQSAAVEDAATRDACTLLQRLGALTPEGEDLRLIRGLEVAIHTYTYTGTVAMDVPRELSFLSEPELLLVTAFGNLADRVRDINHFEQRLRGRGQLGARGSSRQIGLRTRRLSAWGLDLESLTEGAREAYAGLTEVTPPRALPRERVEALAAEVEAAITTLDDATPTIIANAIAGVGTGLTVAPARVPLIVDDEQLTELVVSLGPSRTMMITNQQGSKQLIVCRGLSRPVVRRFKDAIRRSEPVVRFLVVGAKENDFGVKPKGLRALDWDVDAAATRDQVAAWVSSWLLAQPA